MATDLMGVMAAPIFAVALLGGCTRPPPSGQVLASVEGEDITKRDLAEEMKAQGSADDDEARAQALQRLVDRTLLGRAAREQRLDLTPEYLASVRRSRAQLLASMLIDQVALEAARPTPAQIAAFVTARPWMFANRQYLELDQLAFAPRDGDAARLGGFASIDTAADALRSANRTARRSRAIIDTAKMPEAMAKQLLSSSTPAVSVLAGADATRLVTITRRQPAPIDGQRALSIAGAVLQRITLDDAMAGLIEKERARALIRYATGIGPAAQ